VGVLGGGEEYGGRTAYWCPHGVLDAIFVEGAEVSAERLATTALLEGVLDYENGKSEGLLTTLLNFPPLPLVDDDMIAVSVLTEYDSVSCGDLKGGNCGWLYVYEQFRSNNKVLDKR
jgi:hypothetical protein